MRTPPCGYTPLYLKGRQDTRKRWRSRTQRSLVVIGLQRESVNPWQEPLQPAIDGSQDLIGAVEPVSRASGDLLHDALIHELLDVAVR